MPAVISSIIRFNSTIHSSGKNYYIDLDKFAEVFPHIKGDKKLRFYVVELRNETSKLVKRFKPFKELELKTDEYYSKSWNKLLPCLVIPEDMASQLNIGDNYRITIVVTACDGKPFLPFEFKLIGYDSERVFEGFSRIEAGLLSLSLEQPLLNMAVSYLWDAYVRLEENDVEGARTSVRNSLYVIRDKLVPGIEVVEEAKDFLKNIKSLVNNLADFIHYGGPHPGPAPRSTTEMIILMTIELIRCLAKMIEDKTISLKTAKESEVIA
jgi:hypothetical protein